MTDRKVVSYGDTLLRETDIAHLAPRTWLNDNIISFYYEYAVTNHCFLHADWFAIPGISQKRCLGIDPTFCLFNRTRSFSFGCFLVRMQVVCSACLKVGTDRTEIKQAMRGLKMETKSIIFMPVNDNEDSETAGGGSHWFVY
jgi:hypothetical protein